MKSRNEEGVNINKLNIGLVGYGYIGKIHTMVYNNLPMVFENLSDKYDMSLVVSNKLKDAKETGWKSLYSSIDEVLNDTELNIIDICTPNFLHYEQIRKFASREINIYCEKPMALNFIEAKKMTNLAKHKDLITQVALVYRFMPAVAKAKAIIKSGILGNIISFRGELLHSSYLNPEREMNWRLKKEQSGGGAIMDLGVHLIDTLVFMLGDNKVSSLSARTNTVIKERPNKGHKELSKVNVDDWGLITLELENKSVGTIEVSKVCYNPDSNFHIDIYGEKGYLSISDKEPQNPTFHSFKKEKDQAILENVSHDGYVNYLNSIYPTGKMSMGVMLDMHVASIINMIYNTLENRIVHKETPTFEEGLKAQEIVDLSYESGYKRGVIRTYEDNE